MALIKCPECNKEISDTAKNCIHCGYLLKEDSNVPQSQTIVIAPEKGLFAKKRLNIGTIIFLVFSIFFILLNLLIRLTENDFHSDFNGNLMMIFDMSFLFTIFSAIQSIVILLVPKIRKKWFLVMYLIINLFIIPQFLYIALIEFSISMLLLASAVVFVLGYVFVIKSMVNKE